MISPEQRATIRRYFFHEHWRVGTIATQLGVHPDTVRHAIEVDRFANTTVRLVRSQLDPHKAFLLDTIEQFPTLRATRLLDMIKVRGYVGGYEILRSWVRTQRPRRSREAFFALRTMPGEQAQVDWGHFGHIRVGHARRPLSCFVMTLAYSRGVYARFYLDQRIESFLDGHVRSFEHFGGAPREILYDNLKSVVLDRQGQHIRFQPQLLEFSSHYGYLPKPCAPYRGNEKGKVERTIRYLRDRFFAARAYRDVADLNQQLLIWIDAVAQARKVPDDPAGALVRDAMAAERDVLIRLPTERFDTDCVRAVHSGKTPYVRFETNDYSIPHSYVGRALTLSASEQSVRIFDAATLVAEHPRCWDRKQRVEVSAHLDALADTKRHAAAARGRDRLCIACPSAMTFFAALADRSKPLQPASRRLGHLLDVYGAHAVEQAIADVVVRNAIDPAAVEHVLATRGRPASPIPAPLQLPDSAKRVALPPATLDPFARYTNKAGAK